MRSQSHRPTGLRDFTKLALICVVPATLASGAIGYSLHNIAAGSVFGFLLGLAATLFGWFLSKALWKDVDARRRKRNSADSDCAAGE
jgi:uncharacterized membrane protein YdjX (TVP38/TMEM64 family)